MPQSRLQRLRQTLAEVDRNFLPASLLQEPRVGLASPIDTVLGGGLVCGALHEIAPAAPIHLAAASGWAFAVAARASRERGQVQVQDQVQVQGQVLWIATDYAANEGARPYGPGLDRFGLDSSHLLVLRVPRPVDALWAMEEALRCPALACVIAELTGEGETADLTATRRLALAAREGISSRMSGLGLLIRHRIAAMPSAAATRWEVAAAQSQPDAYGGLGRTRFDIALRKNRRGPSGRWIIEWDHHECAFQPAVPVAVVAAALDRPDRAPSARAC